ncbi:MAG: DUF192 domain-containing protein [Chloroflexi bacterium]|nr:DUF192 domain-containing protein [Chloroflexota bacterium]
MPVTKRKNLGNRLERRRPLRRLASTRCIMMALAVGLLALSVACGSSTTATPKPDPTEPPVVTPTNTSASGTTAAPTTDETPNTGPLVRVEDLDFPVEVAANSEQRIRGLSGRASLDAGTGMLFIFEKPERFRFWMREMEIPLDIVWIGSSCEVGDGSENVPFPDPETPLSDLPRYSPESRAKFVLEINGGEAADLGLGIGDKVEFLNEIAGKYDC